MNTQCQGHRHSPKFNDMPFVCCARCQHFSANGQPAPSLQQWVGGLCPQEKKA